MALKDIILDTLEQNRGTYLSGQQLADSLGVSRAAVCKAINSLKALGYNIDSVQNKGYCFHTSNDILSAAGICPFLPENLASIPLFVHDCIDSTNAECKRLALTDAKDFTVVVANEQTAGRGRLGRSFYSPSNTGIYMSFLLKPKMDLSSATLITTAASVAVARAITKVTGIQPSIKWINDLYVNGRKICGILTEAVADFESGMVASLVLGIGINVSTVTEDFPEELRDIAGSILGDGTANVTPAISNSSDTRATISRSALVAAVIEEVHRIYHNLNAEEFLADYKAWSMVLGKQVYYIKNDVKYYGTAVDITDTGALIVKKDNDELETLSSGEVTLRVV